MGTAPAGGLTPPGFPPSSRGPCTPFPSEATWGPSPSFSLLERRPASDRWSTATRVSPVPPLGGRSGGRFEAPIRMAAFSAVVGAALRGRPSPYDRNLAGRLGSPLAAGAPTPGNHKTSGGLSRPGRMIGDEDLDLHPLSRACRLLVGKRPHPRFVHPVVGVVPREEPAEQFLALVEVLLHRAVLVGCEIEGDVHVTVEHVGRLDPLHQIEARPEAGAAAEPVAIQGAIIVDPGRRERVAGEKHPPPAALDQEAPVIKRLPRQMIRRHLELAPLPRLAVSGDLVDPGDARRDAGDSPGDRVGDHLGHVPVGITGAIERFLKRRDRRRVVW